MGSMDVGNKSWNVQRLDVQEFSDRTRGKLMNVFSQPIFSELNRSKVDDIWYLLVNKGGSSRFAVTMGIAGERALCPFSAPFGYPEAIKDGLGVDSYKEVGCVLDDYFANNGIKSVKFTFPPSFYDPRAIETWMNVLFYLGWSIETIDISFGFHIPTILENYDAQIARNARKNLRIAREAGLCLTHCETPAQKDEAYRVIKINRDSKGYPLRMTQMQVQQTMQVVSSNEYLISCENENIAAALVYDVTPSVAQVIYWGDVPGHSEKKSINYLAYELLKLYSQRGFEYLDIGPSTENGVPNYGLCDFKDSIGCQRTAKYSLVKTYTAE